MSTSLLVEEPPLVVLPTLAKRIGLAEALAVQQLHWEIQSHPTLTEEIDGRSWLRAGIDFWELKFPFWSEPTIKRTFASLRERGLVETRRGREASVYSINTDHPDLCGSLHRSNWPVRTDQIDPCGAVSTDQIDPSPCKGEKRIGENVVVESADAEATAPELPGMPAAPPEPPSSEDPRVQDVFDFWVQEFDPPRKNLSDSRRKLIQKGLREAEQAPGDPGAADVCKTALAGLKVWRKQRPGDESLGAIFQTRPGGSSLGDQMDFFVKQAMDNQSAVYGRVPIDLSGVPSVTAGTIRNHRANIRNAVKRPDDEEAQRQARYCMDQLATHYGHQTVIEGDDVSWTLIEGWVRT